MLNNPEQTQEITTLITNSSETLTTVTEEAAVAAPKTETPGLNTAAAHGRIAYFSNKDGDYEIYVMNADGSGIVQLTDNDVYEWYPCFSNDGKIIIFTSGRDWDPEIFIMNSDGSGILRLTDNNIDDYDGSWISY